MIYFTKNFLQFLKELPANNNRDWFAINKKRYETEVKIPFEHFISDLIIKMNPFFPSLDITYKESIFRINRDIRFSKDKSPYKIHVSAVVSPGGRKDFTQTGLYIQLSAEDTRIYSGLHELNLLQLEKVRVKILTETDRFISIINNKAFQENFGTILGEKYKKTPKGYEKVAEKTDLILNKQFYYYKTFEPTLILKNDCMEIIIENYKSAIPINTFFNEALA